jgi:ketosteroid isomerase-like protein
MTSERTRLAARDTVGDAARAAATYFDSWRAKDFETFRSVLADDVVFDGPLAHLDGADDVQRGIEGLAQITTDVVVRKTFTDGKDVLTWFDLHTSAAPPISVANWSHVEDGRITKIQVVFDPRPLTGK